MMSDDVTPHSSNIVICTDALVVLDLLSHVEHSASCLTTPRRLDHSLAVEEVNRQHRLFCDNGTVHESSSAHPDHNNTSLRSCIRQVILSDHDDKVL